MRHEEQTEELLEDSSLPLLLPTPYIFIGDWKVFLPPEFNTVTVYLNARMESDLDWKDARLEAQQAVEKGYYLLWKMDFGLFDALKQPLTQQGQFLAFTLALEHFRDFLWPEFSSKTMGLSLFCGNADFSVNFPWDPQQEESLAEWLREHQLFELASLPLSALQNHPGRQRLLSLFCRDVAMEYLSLLAARLPDFIPLYLLLNASSFAKDLTTQIQLLHPERFDRFHLILKGTTLPFEVMGWDVPTAWGYLGETSTTLPPESLPSIGICLPPLDCIQDFHYQGFEEVIAILEEKGLPFKLLAENQLTLHWTGLDFLFYFSSGLSVQGRRKLQGFCAAGGIPVAVQEGIGLPEECDLKTWMVEYETRTRQDVY